MALTQRTASAAYRLGWLVVRRVPESWARWVFRQIADILWRRQGKGVQQLEANLRRVAPGATIKQLRELSRAGMRSLRCRASVTCSFRRGIAASGRPGPIESVRTRRTRLCRPFFCWVDPRRVLPAGRALGIAHCR
jgi:hypothetical protein